jgi:hypothetical protein
MNHTSKRINHVVGTASAIPTVDDASQSQNNPCHRYLQSDPLGLSPQGLIIGRGVILAAGPGRSFPTVWNRRGRDLKKTPLFI